MNFFVRNSKNIRIFAARNLNNENRLKIMDYEKLYNQTLEKAKDLYKRTDHAFSHLEVRRELVNIFPELYESEDDKMRKFIIEQLHKLIGVLTKENNEEYNQKYLDAISWLKKTAIRFKVGDFVKVVNYHGEPVYEIVRTDNECYICEYRGHENMGDKQVMHFAFDNPYLRPVPRWKPTEEQMADLYTMFCECRPADQQLLQDIYYGLKSNM